MSSSKTQTFCQGAFRASKTNMTNGIYLLTVTVFSRFKCASFSLKMQPMKWYEWVRCGSWCLQGSSPHKGRRLLANGMPRVRLDEKQRMNMTWVRTPQILLAAAVPNAHKTCWPTHLPKAVQGLGPAFSGAHYEIHSRFPWSWGPGFSLRDWPSRFVFKIALILQPVDTRSLRSARRWMMALRKFMIDIWSLQHFATPRVAVNALHTFWVLYPPKVSLRSDILEARHHVRSFNLVNC